jgi:hypothetical protein
MVDYFRESCGTRFRCEERSTLNSDLNLGPFASRRPGVGKFNVREMYDRNDMGNVQSESSRPAQGGVIDIYVPYSHTIFSLVSKRRESVDPLTSGGDTFINDDIVLDCPHKGIQRHTWIIPYGPGPSALNETGHRPNSPNRAIGCNET